jgi:hypothetical protein
MQTTGLIAVILFLASLAAYMWAFINIRMVGWGGALGTLLLLAAFGLLAVAIKKRNKTERI